MGHHWEARSRLVGRLRRVGRGACLRHCLRGADRAFCLAEPRDCGVRVLFVGDGQDCLDRGDVDRRAKAGGGLSLAMAFAPAYGEYIVHGHRTARILHLTHLQKPEAKASSTSRFSTSIRCSSRSLLGVLGCWLLWRAARKATSGVPGRFQAAVEILVEMVDSQAKGIVHNANSRKLVAPLALTGVRLDLPDERDGPAAGGPAAVIWERSTAPPAAIRTTPTCASCPPPTCRSPWACRCRVLLSASSTTSRSRALGGWMHELFTAPFGDTRYLWPFNFADADHRVRRQDRLARHAAVRQHVRRRTDLHADRADGRRLVASATGASAWRSATSLPARRGRSSTS
jgi:hypothetical protein